MTARYTLYFTAEARAQLSDLGRVDVRKGRKVRKSLAMLGELGPRYPALHSHKYVGLTGPNGEEVWESYVENNTPGAWRIWWVYGPGKDEITVVTVGKHP